MNVVCGALVMCGASYTVIVMFSVASGNVPLAATNCTLYVLPVPAAGVPCRLTVVTLSPLPFVDDTGAARLNPVGSEPLEIEIVGTPGYPVAVYVYEPKLPTVNDGEVLPVSVGDWFTVSVNVWFVVPKWFFALMVKMYTPPAVEAGVPERVAVPSPLSVKMEQAMLPEQVSFATPCAASTSVVTV